MAKIKVRALTELEQGWITEHYVKEKLTLENLVAKLPGVDLNEIQDFVSKLYIAPTPTDDPSKRQTQMASLPPAGKFMGRDPERGIAIMTEAASEISDARRTVAVPSNDTMARRNPNIHVINPSKRVR